MSTDPSWSRGLPVPSDANRDREVPAPARSSGATLWIGVGVVFALMALAWTAMFFFASKYRADDVRTPTKEAH
jgi:hypothetical protein